MAILQFDQEAMLTGNLFKYEERLHSHLNKFHDNGMILTTYYNLAEDATTVDRGIQEIEQVFGNKSPLRFNKIEKFPLTGFAQTNPENTDESSIEDIMVNGECQVIPSTIVPHQNDVFIINHLKMKALFQVTAVSYDSMKVDGFYKISYRLFGTSEEDLINVEKQTIQNFICDLNSVGATLNPIIQKDDFITKKCVEKMIDEMIDTYRGIFYNERHNCFLFYDKTKGQRYFDLAGNMFMAKHSIINHINGTNVIMLHSKLIESREELLYNSSVYKWLERDCPKKFLQKFKFQIYPVDAYIDSSFYKWGDTDIEVMLPAEPTCKSNGTIECFTTEQVKLFEEDLCGNSLYDTLISRYINGHLKSYKDINLDVADALFSTLKSKEIYLYTPIIIYIIRKILQFN